MIAVIPARGGSKRVPHKNIRAFWGHPLIAYSIGSALNSKLFSRVIVSTDDPLTGRIAEWYGAEYLARPTELAADSASLVDVALHALDSLADRNGRMPKALCQLMPNCPLRRHEDIVWLYEAFERNDRRFQISVVPYRGCYPQWAVVGDEEGEGSWAFGAEHLSSSQKLAKTYCPTGAVWWVSVPDFLAQKAFYGTPFHIEPMDADRGLDIDREEELELADLLVRGLRDRDGSSPLETVAREPFPEAIVG